MFRRLIEGARSYKSKWEKEVFGFFTGSSVAEPVDEFPPDDYILTELDCTSKIHRKYCRKFNREIRELYWLHYDEVTEPGNYVRFEGGFHVPQNAVIVMFEGQLVELRRSGMENPRPLDKKSAYLGPIPRVPDYLVPDAFGEE